MNYIGSKQSLAPFILQTLEKCFGSLEQLSFCDLFSGTGAIAHEAALTCKEVIANDAELYSALWLKQRLCGVSDYGHWFDKIICEKYGFISEHFSPLGEAKRGYFTPQNALKIDGIRAKIEDLKPQISPTLHIALLASLLDASDRVANVASVYGSYLKKLKFTATQDLALRECKSACFNNTRVYNEEGLELLGKIKGDILYLDPPYNHRQYGLNYHVLNAIARGYANSPKGKSGFDGYYRSKWCQRQKVEDELQSTIALANYKYIAMSYNSEGLLEAKQIEAIFKSFGHYEQFQIPHPRLRTQKKSPKANVIEYLHLVEKR